VVSWGKSEAMAEVDSFSGLFYFSSGRLDEWVKGAVIKIQIEIFIK
jgi:hypothetical protein